jgi:hypothetical protein
MLSLLTEKPSKNDKAWDELDMGTVHIDKHRTIKVFLSNITGVTAKWRLNYVSFPKKPTVGYSTMTPWERENLHKNDDPDVFEFSVTDGVLKGQSLPLRKLPEGLNAVPIPKDEEERKYLPQTILINFKVTNHYSLNHLFILYLAQEKRPLQVQVPLHCRKRYFLRCYS